MHAYYIAWALKRATIEAPQTSPAHFLFKSLNDLTRSFDQVVYHIARSS